jgi:DNA-3-methyladenine glycosylase
MHHNIAEIEKLKPLERTFFARPTVTVAHALLGKIVVRAFDDDTIAAGMIVETEAYTGVEDPASHAYRGNTVRTRAMFEAPGHAYIYFIYGMYYCLNAVAKAEEQQAGGVLIRALEPIVGIERMHQEAPGHTPHKLTNGPGKLTRALHINRALYGTDLTYKGPLYICDYRILQEKDIMAGPRIGISKAVEHPWRFYIKDNPCVSR